MTGLPGGTAAKLERLLQRHGGKSSGATMREDHEDTYQLGGHQPGYTQNRNHGKFAAGNGGEHASGEGGSGSGGAGGKSGGYGARQGKRDTAFYRKAVTRAAKNEMDAHHEMMAAHRRVVAASTAHAAMRSPTTRRALDQAIAQHAERGAEHDRALAALRNGHGMLAAVAPAIRQSMQQVHASETAAGGSASMAAGVMDASRVQTTRKDGRMTTKKPTRTMRRSTTRTRTRRPPWTTTAPTTRTNCSRRAASS